MIAQKGCKTVTISNKMLDNIIMLIIMLAFI